MKNESLRVIFPASYLKTDKPLLNPEELSIIMKLWVLSVKGGFN